MERRLILVMIVLGVLGWGMLKTVEWQFGVGEFAKSPQMMMLRPGGRVIVGGGRAVLGLVAIRDEKAEIEIRCDEAEHEIRLRPGGASEKLCDVYVRWLGPSVRVPGTQQLEVSWNVR